MSKEALTEKQIEEAYARWLCGEHIADIARSLFVAERTLRRMFRRWENNKKRTL